MSLGIVVNGGWPECAQKHLHNVILRYAMRKDETVVAAKIYWRCPFSISLSLKVCISVQKRLNKSGLRTVVHLDI